MAGKRFKICSVCGSEQRQELMMFLDEDSICLACAVSMSEFIDDNERELHEVKEYDYNIEAIIKFTSKGNLYYPDEDHDNVFHII